MKIIQTKAQKRYNKAKQNVQAILIAFICLASFVAILAVDRTEAQSTLNCNGSNFCSKVDDEASPFGEIKEITTKEQTEQTQTPEKEEPCHHIEILYKNQAKKSINCDDLKTVIKHFGKDEKLIAILLHESALDRTATNINKNGSIDRGIYMLNSDYWSFRAGDLEYSSEQAKKCKQQLGYSCWWAYRNGEYKQHIDNAKYLLSKI